MAELNKISKKESSERNKELILKAISDIKYGSVMAIIQDGKIVQVEKNEKIRIK